MGEVDETLRKVGILPWENDESCGILKKFIKVSRKMKL